MIAQRVGTTALRRAAAKQSGVFFNQNLARSLVAANLAATQTRPASTEKLASDTATTLLASQRLRRPVSPHLEIYDKAQTWFGASIFQRFTGVGLTAALYVYAAAYLVAPLAGWHLESASVAAAFGAWPLLVKLGVKFGVAWPFAFHAFNGMRHLVFDLGLGFAKATIKSQGWAIWGASLVTGLGIAFLL